MSTILLIAPCRFSPERNALGSPKAGAGADEGATELVSDAAGAEIGGAGAGAVSGAGTGAGAVTSAASGVTGAGEGVAAGVGLGCDSVGLWQRSGRDLHEPSPPSGQGSPSPWYHKSPQSCHQWESCLRKSRLDKAEAIKCRKKATWEDNLLASRRMTLGLLDFGL